MERKSTLIVAGFAAAVLLGAGGAPLAHAGDPGSGGSIGSSTQQFLSKSSQGNLAEIEVGRLAMTHSKNASIQALGYRLAADGASGESTLEATAGLLNVKLPAKPDAKQQRAIAKLKGMKGGQFDKAFLKTELTAQNKSLRSLKHESNNAGNRAVKLWAKESVGEAKQHVQLAQAAATSMGVSR